jgi:hypothetical protein
VPKNKNSVGLSKIDLLLLLWSLRQKLNKAGVKNQDKVALDKLFKAFSEFINKVGRKANEPWQEFFSAQALAMMSLSTVMTHHGGVEMAKIDLGITTKELLALIPGLIGDVWPLYNDDQKISADEGIMIAAVLFRALAEPTDDQYAKAFFLAQAEAFESLAPLFASTVE